MSQGVPERIWLPTSVVQLVAVSPELKEVDGGYWVPESALATVRREAFRDVLMVAKANLKIGPTDPLDTGWNLALAELIAALEAAATEKK